MATNKLTSLAAKVLLAASLVWAGTDDKPKTMKKEDKLQWENYSLKTQLIQQQLEAVQNQHRQLFMDVCRGAGIVAPDFASMAGLCEIDAGGGTITKKVAVPATKVPDATKQ